MNPQDVSIMTVIGNSINNFSVGEVYCNTVVNTMLLVQATKLLVYSTQLWLHVSGTQQRFIRPGSLLI